jgi:hypothetical protein
VVLRPQTRWPRVPHLRDAQGPWEAIGAASWLNHADLLRPGDSLGLSDGRNRSGRVEEERDDFGDPGRILLVPGIGSCQFTKTNAELGEA